MPVLFLTMCAHAVSVVSQTWCGLNAPPYPVNPNAGVNLSAPTPFAFGYEGFGLHN